jgi:hypothetical protein
MYRHAVGALVFVSGVCVVMVSLRVRKLRG